MTTNYVQGSLTTPAVIVGADVHGLGLARSLGRAGIPVFIADTDSRLPGMHSRFVHPFLLTAMSGPALVDGLLALRTRLAVKPMLFLTSDLQVRTVSENQ